jgi:endonuclease III
VLLFCFDKPVFPVDTHVGRISRRLGLAGPKASEEKIKATWESLVPAQWYYALHLNLIRHGRQVCRARVPDCLACVLNDICLYFGELTKGAKLMTSRATDASKNLPDPCQSALLDVE